MSSSNTTEELIVSLNYAASIMNRYLSIFIYIFGLIGNTLNVFVLSQQTLRSNPSAIYFNISSIAGIIVILSGLTSRMLSSYAIDLTLTVGWICKLRNFILYSSRTIVLCMITLAAMDRWLLSSILQSYRLMSNLKNTWRNCLLVLIYSCIINIPILYCYEANLTWALRQCYGSTYICRISTDLIYAFGTILLPLVLMMIFGLLTINHVHNVKSRVKTTSQMAISQGAKINTTNLSGTRRTKRKIDQALLKILLIQVILLILLTCPHALEKVYSSFAPNPPIQSLESTIKNFILDFLTLLTFVASGMPFYVYTLSGGSAFRNALLHVLKTFIQKIYCN